MEHRNRALAAARQARAVQLATEGKTYQEVADELARAAARPTASSTKPWSAIAKTPWRDADGAGELTGLAQHRRRVFMM
jgi:hypothetical protein